MKENKNWKKQTLNTFLSRLIDKGLLERKKEETKAYYGAALTKAEFKQRKAKAILEECYEGKISHFIAALTGNNAITKGTDRTYFRQVITDSWGKRR